MNKMHLAFQMAELGLHLKQEELIRHGKMLIHVENIMVKKQMEKINNNLSQILEIKEEIIELIEQAEAKMTKKELYSTGIL